MYDDELWINKYNNLSVDIFQLKKKINDVEVSWGLGAAFQLLVQVGLVR